MRNGKMEMESNLESADRLYVWFTLSLPYDFSFGVFLVFPNL